MTTEHQPATSCRLRYPRYLIDSECRTLIDTIQGAGVSIAIFVPALGSVEVVATLPDGETRTEQGRPETLADTLRSAAQRCGLDLFDRA